MREFILVIAIISGLMAVAQHRMANDPVEASETNSAVCPDGHIVSYRYEFDLKGEFRGLGYNCVPVTQIGL
jgi:hypothetical protein